MMLSTLVSGCFAVFISLWRAVPQWSIGCWSLRTQYALTPTSSLDGLLRSYHRALDNGYSHALHPFLIGRLQSTAASDQEKQAILRFYGLRTERSRASAELFAQGRDRIGDVLKATMDSDPVIRPGAVFLMEGLYRQRELYKPSLFAEPDGSAVGLSESEVVLRAYIAYYDWWSLPAARREERAPLDGLGVSVGEP